MSLQGKYVGLGYPFTKGMLGYPNIKKDEELIRDSIFQILHTRKGERFFNREFGSNLHLLVFEPNDDILKDLIDIEVREAIEKYEPRVEILKTEVYIQGNQISVSITYKIKETQQEDFLIFQLQK